MWLLIVWHPASRCQGCGAFLLCSDIFRQCFAGVFDVAGGRGSLSFALQVQHGVTCTVVDPRPPKPTKEQLRFLRQLQGPAACLQDLPMQPGQGPGQRELPEHIQAAFDEDFWSGPHARRLHAASLIVGLHPDQASTPGCMPDSVPGLGDGITSSACPHWNAWQCVMLASGRGDLH